MRGEGYLFVVRLVRQDSNLADIAMTPHRDLALALVLARCPDLGQLCAGTEVFATNFRL